MPAFIFWCVLSVAFAQLILLWTTNQIPEGGFGDHKRKLFHRNLLWYSSLVVLISSLGVLGSSLFVAFPKSLNSQIAGAATFTAMLGFYIAWKDTKLEMRRLRAGALGTVVLAAAAYLTGVQEARSAIEKTANVYKLNLKGDQTNSAVLLRTFEKGILIWNTDRQTAEMLRWEQLEGLSHIVAFDKVSTACRISSWFCQPQVEP
jgi:hypothetical protein